MTFVKDDAARHGGAEGSSIAGATAGGGEWRNRFAEAAIGGRSKLEAPLVLDAFGSPWHAWTN
uniref:Phosphatidylinositol kinase n=1 Tax=Agrobacterium tumefaciens TaxID=358 RepID=A0A2Z2Q2U2_AGRTU|nr:phosphatidylinositol kinase [Agrobacterium radiobacter]